MLKDESISSPEDVEAVVAERPRHRFTKSERLKIRDDFAQQNGGVFDCRLFVEAAKNPSHPAHAWFTWDDNLAGYRWRLEQARAFNAGLVVVKLVTTSDAGVEVKIKVAVPSYLSTLSERPNGGGYRPYSQAEAVRQAAMDLQAFAKRHRAVLLAVHVDHLINEAATKLAAEIID